MDVRTDVQIPPVFYRTSSSPVPSGAAAQKEINEGKERNWKMRTKMITKGREMQESNEEERVGKRGRSEGK